MNSKEINRESGRRFGMLLRSNWALRSQEDQEDYGVDAEIEVRDSNDKSTGILFKIQIKGFEKGSFKRDGTLVYRKASVERFKYYTEQLEIPTLFVGYDLANDSCYWLRIQGSRTVEKALAQAFGKGQKTFTVDFPIENRWSREESSITAIVEAVGASSDSIAIRQIRKISPIAIREMSGDAQLAGDLEASFRKLAGLAANQKIERLLESGDFQSALDEADVIFKDVKELPDVRISAALAIVHAVNGMELEDDTPSRKFKVGDLRMQIAGDILRISRDKRASSHLRLYAVAYARTARLRRNGESFKSYVLSEMFQKEGGADMVLPFTELLRVDCGNRITRDFVATQKWFHKLYETEWVFLAPYVWSDWAGSMVSFLWALRKADKHELANQYVLEMDRIFAACFSVIRLNKDRTEAFRQLRDNGLRFVSISLLSDKLGSKPRIEKLMGIVGDEISKDYCSRAISEISKSIDELEAEANNLPPLNIEETKNIFEELARGLGYDMDNEADQGAEAIRIGLRDLDPTRVAKTCKHIYLATTSRGIPGLEVALPTAGFKRIVCLKHGHGNEGLELDRVFETFSKCSPWDEGRVCCETCKDISPHENGWKWSDEWSQSQHERYQEEVSKRKSPRK